MRNWQWLLLALACAVAGTGCVNLSRTLEPEAIFPSPSSAVNVGNLPKDSSGTVCVTTALLSDGNIPAELTQFAVAMYCAYQRKPGDTDYVQWMVRFVDKGLSLSDQTCERFFDQLEARRVEANYAQTNMNLGAAAVTAILAITDTHNRAVFNLATALAAGNAWFENYKGNYIMAPQTRKVHDLIQNDLRTPIRSQILAKSQANGYRSFDEAKQDVMKYDALCSHKVIQDVITEAVATSRLKPFEAVVDTEKSQKADAEKREIYKIASGGTVGQFSGSEFEALYVVATMPTAAERMQAAKALVDLDSRFKAAVTNLGLDIAATPPTSTRFQYIGELLGLEGSPSVESVRKQIKDRMDANAKNPPPAAGGPPGAPVPVNPAAAASLNSAQQAFQKSMQAPPPRATGSIDFRWDIRDHLRR